MTRTLRPTPRRAFTLYELLIVIAVVIIVLVTAFIWLRRSVLTTFHQVYCSANVRGITQGMVLFAQNNQDRYPLPSKLDKANATINADPATKDTTANIISTLIHGTFFGPEICVCVGESNPSITRCEDYEYKDPQQAADPKLALFDPKFSADFTAAQGGHFSYAHMLPSGNRLDLWSNTFQDTEAILGDRGPRITGATARTPTSVTPTFNASQSIANHGARRIWHGNIAYNDNHVNFESEMWGTNVKGKTITYTSRAAIPWPDLLHYDEPDDKDATNNFLGIFTTSGKTSQEFKPIWD